MENYTDVYKYLTGVDIEKEAALWDERGKGYYGEFLVFCELLDKLPYPSKILMNLHIPAYSGKTTEIDLITITPVGIIVFEIKHYKGIIYGSGDGSVWTQYFKTQPNNTFQNPIKQNEYHCNAMNKLTNLPVFSVVVFTNSDCDLRLDNINTPVCRLFEAAEFAKNLIFSRPKILNNDNVEYYFKKLSIYSRMTVSVSADGDPLPFNEWIYKYHEAFLEFNKNHQKILNKKNEEFNRQKDRELTELKQKNESVHTQYKGKLKTLLITGIIGIPLTIAILLAIGIPVISNNKKQYEIAINEAKENYSAEISGLEQRYEKSLSGISDNYNKSLSEMSDKYNASIDSMQSELDEMNSKFEKVEKHKNIPLSSIISIENISLTESAENNTIINYLLALKDDFYNVQFHGNSTFIVGIKDGSVKEYPALQESLRETYTTVDMWLYKKKENIKSLPMLLSGIKPDEISYIKLTNGSLYEWNNGNPILIEENEELLLYEE